MEEGLKYELIESPAVSGATEYKQLCLAARNEEKRLIDLEKRRKFSHLSRQPTVVYNQQPGETSEQFIMALYELAENCEYGALRDEMIRDRIVVGIRDCSLS